MSISAFLKNMCIKIDRLAIKVDCGAKGSSCHHVNGMCNVGKISPWATMIYQATIYDTVDYVLAAWYSKCTPRSSDSTGAGLGALSAQTGQILVDVLLEQYTSLMTCQGHPCWHIRELADRLVEQIGRMKMHVLV